MSAETTNNLKPLASFSYEPQPVQRGYAGRTLYVNVSDNTIQSKPVTQQMKDIFIGGRGFGLYLLWHSVRDNTRWNDPENELVIASGPLGGTTSFPGSGKSLVVGISPLTDSVMDSNVGGYFGPLLKFAGWDALEVQGKAEKDVIVYIDGDKGQATIYEAPEGVSDSYPVGEQMLALFTPSEEEKRDISVVSAGRGAEHALMGCLNFSWYDSRRQRARLKQAGRGGMGTLLRDKKVKAIVVKRAGVRGDTNNPADLERVRRVGLKMHREMHDLDHLQRHMREVGTAHLVQIMNDYDLLPTYNFKYGEHPEAPKLNKEVFFKLFTQGIPDGCWYSCTMACSKAVDDFTLKTGPYKGQVVSVDGPEYETTAGCGSNLGIFDPVAVIEINYYCDTYGIDTISFGTSTAFAMECYEAGILNRERCGGLELRFGNAEATLELLHQMARGEGFGVTVGQGVRKMKALFAKRFNLSASQIAFMQDIGMESKGLEFSEYVTKESLAMQGGYGLTLKGPQHDEAWLIFMDLVNNQIPTFQDKAEALHYFPMWRTWFGLNGLCKIIWNDIEPADNRKSEAPAKVPEHVRNYVEYFAGVTGRDVKSGGDLILMSEKVYNFQRVFNIRLGHGLRRDDAIPYRSMGPVTEEEYLSRQERYDTQLAKIVGVDPQGKSTAEKLAALRAHREKQYELLADAVYARRGWTSQGVPTPEKLAEMGIDFPDVLAVVKKHL